jgi:hypothetical protein
MSGLGQVSSSPYRSTRQSGSQLRTDSSTFGSAPGVRLPTHTHTTRHQSTHNSSKFKSDKQIPNRGGNKRLLYVFIKFVNKNHLRKTGSGDVTTRAPPLSTKTFRQVFNEGVIFKNKFFFSTNNACLMFHMGLRNACIFKCCES